MVKRFYKEVTTGPGFTVLLDTRPVKTPNGNALTLPTEALAQALAEEWRAQGEEITPAAMPLTKLAFAATDGAPHAERIAEELLAYGKSDLLCYRAEHPDELVIRQAHGWTPLLDWLAETHQARLKTGTGIAFIEQPPETVAALKTALAAQPPYALAALHTAAGITGSLVLALALAARRLTPEEAFALSRIDESFQAEKWGLDSEAEARAAALLSALQSAARFLELAA